MYGAQGVPPVHLSSYPLKGSNPSSLPLEGVRVGVFKDHFEDGEEVVVQACKVSESVSGEIDDSVIEVHMI
jgi:hypothetical protein